MAFLFYDSNSVLAKPADSRVRSGHQPELHRPRFGLGRAWRTGKSKKTECFRAVFEQESPFGTLREMWMSSSATKSSSDRPPMALAVRGLGRRRSAQICWTSHQRSHKSLTNISWSTAGPWHPNSRFFISSCLSLFSFMFFLFLIFFFFEESLEVCLGRDDDASICEI